MVKLALLKDLACSQSDLYPRREVTVKFHPPGQVLSEIQNRIPLWRMDHFFYGKGIFFPDRKAEPVAEFSAMIRRLQKNYALSVHALSSGVILLPVIDIIEKNRRRAGLPCVIGTDDAFSFLP